MTLNKISQKVKIKLVRIKKSIKMIQKKICWMKMKSMKILKRKKLKKAIKFSNNKSHQNM